MSSSVPSHFDLYSLYYLCQPGWRSLYVSTDESKYSYSLPLWRSGHLLLASRAELWHRTGPASVFVRFQIWQIASSSEFTTSGTKTILVNSARIVAQQSNLWQNNVILISLFVNTSNSLFKTSESNTHLHRYKTAEVWSVVTMPL